MINILGPDDCNGPYIIKGLKDIMSISGVKLHIYGKKISRPKRKLGHITVTANSVKKAMARAEEVKNVLKIEDIKKVNQNG
jgi:5-(carboxyamino)imidazole ribonucleotide synthase